MKRKKQEPNCQLQKEEKKVRRVVIDSDSDEQEIEGQKKNELGNGDEVVNEIDIFFVSASNSITAEGEDHPIVNLNRLQFPQQHPKLLERYFAENGEFGGKCQAHYKSQVRHLKLQFGEGEEEKMRAKNHQNNGRQNCEGIVDLLMRSPSSSSSTSTAISSIPKTKKNSAIFMGEGCSQHGVFSHAVGIFDQGKLFLFPIDKTYEMRKPLEGSSEKEAAKLIQKAANLKASSASSAQDTSSNLAPLRVRFTRAENEIQKRRREQSAIFKQKMVDKDHWMPMEVEKSELVKFYGMNNGKVRKDGQ